MSENGDRGEPQYDDDQAYNNSSYSNPTEFHKLDALAFREQRKLHVSGLSEDITDEELSRIFSKYGEIENVKVIYDRETGKARGFAFVTFKNKKEADDAIEGTREKEHDGMKLRLTYAEKRKDKFKNAPANVCYDWLKKGCERENCRFEHSDVDRDSRGRDRYESRDGRGRYDSRDGRDRYDSRESRDRYDSRDSRDTRDRSYERERERGYERDRDRDYDRDTRDRGYDREPRGDRGYERERGDRGYDRDRGDRASSSAGYERGYDRAVPPPSSSSSSYDKGYDDRYHPDARGPSSSSSSKYGSAPAADYDSYRKYPPAPGYPPADSYRYGTAPPSYGYPPESGRYPDSYPPPAGGSDRGYPPADYARDSDRGSGAPGGYAPYYYPQDRSRGGYEGDGYRGGYPASSAPPPAVDDRRRSEDYDRARYYDAPSADAYARGAPAPSYRSSAK